MQPGSSKSVVLFDVSKVDFTYVATAPGGGNMELYPFKIGFYRLNYKDIKNIYSYYHTYNVEIVVMWMLIVGCSSCLLVFIIKYYF